MKNNSNIYDIDGVLIRESGDNHSITLEETQEKIKYYNEKIENLEKEDPTSYKLDVYKSYIVNLNKYIWTLYSRMSPEELNAVIAKAKSQLSTAEQVENAMNELKKDLDEEHEFAEYEEI